MAHTFIVPAGRTASGGIGMDQSVGHLSDRAVTADRKDRVIFFHGGLMRDDCRVAAAERLSDFHLPARGVQRTQNAAHERFHRHASRSGIIEQQSSAHEEIITAACPADLLADQGLLGQQADRVRRAASLSIRRG